MTAQDKVNPAMKQQTREELCLYVSNVIREALYPLTITEQEKVLAWVRGDKPVGLSPTDIHDLIVKTLKQQVGPLVVSQIENPNSDISRSIQRTVGIGRPRT